MKTYNKKPRLDVMVDLETASCKPEAAILSISMVPFMINGESLYKDDQLKEVNIFVDLSSCFFEGHDIDKETQMWWSIQDSEVKEEFLQADRIDIRSAVNSVHSLLDWWCSNYDVFVWSKGTDFDFPILEYCFDKYLSSKAPYKYWNKRDVRTYICDCPDIETMKFNSSTEKAHRSIDDCKHQIEQVCKRWKLLHPVNLK